MPLASPSSAASATRSSRAWRRPVRSHDKIILRQCPAPHHWEYRNPKLGRDFSIIDRLIKWPDGRNMRVEFATDITERKLVEEALRESERRYRLLVDNAEIAVVITSMTTGEVLFGNQRASILFDVPMDKVIGRQARQHWVHPEDRDRFIAELTRVGRVTDYECALKTGGARSSGCSSGKLDRLRRGTGGVCRVQRCHGAQAGRGGPS